MGSFFELGLQKHLGYENQLVKLDGLLDWGRFLDILKGVHKESGPTGYCTLKMFKALLLGQWHSLSDPALEQSLRVRLDFLQFTGFCLGDNLPDETTFCRFRNKLVKQNKFEALFNEVNRQLKALGLKVESANTAIVDATIITSSARPNKVLQPTDEQNHSIEYSADSDARWLKKGKKSHFGYRVFTRCDEEGFIDKTNTKPANTAETKELDIMTDGLAQGTRVLTDKGFFSAQNKEILKKKGLKNGLMYKAFANKPLTKHMLKFNKLVSKNRWRIEQCFGTLKRRFGYFKASYFTTTKVDAQFKMKAICLNLLKALNKVHLA